MRVQRITRINEFTNGFGHLKTTVIRKRLPVTQLENTVSRSFLSRFLSVNSVY